MNGGYIMIDCTGLDLTKGTTPQTVEGLYQRVKSAMTHNKPLFANNAIWGSGKAVTPIQVFAIDFGDSGIICTASTLQVVVFTDDSVVIHNMAPAE